MEPAGGEGPDAASGRVPSPGGSPAAVPGIGASASTAAMAATAAMLAGMGGR
jgi:hypothetical protein